jgi:polyisoprenoid-binding protein YceI
MALTPPPPGTYKIDVDESEVAFDTTHLFGLGKVHGTMSFSSGSVEVREPLENSSLAATLDVASFSTNNKGRDKAVLSPRFLDAAQFPRFEFTSSGFRQTGATWSVDGTLSVKGVSASVSFEIESVVVLEGGFRATATGVIDRTEFGVTKAKGMAGRRLTCTVTIAAHLES